ncbi:hypothetical protein [Vulgatibacter sp.]|uniref:hypothetical protein n=1 Tax=Vulgatibacter sp. TaxID=1971226 RepID=UPI003569F220
MICPDGSSVRLPPTETEQPKGGIRGTARYFGREDNAGIEVKLANHEIRTETDETGAFVLENVPAGFHEVLFDAPGYEPDVRGELMVLPGAWTNEDVELGIGRRILDGRDWSLVPSPRDDLFLALRSDLYLVDPVALRTERIAGNVHSATFADGGEKIVVVHGQEDVRLSLFEVDARRMTEVARNVTNWQVTPDGDGVVYERIAEGRSSLEVWHHPTRRRSPVGRDVLGWRLSDDGGALVALVQAGGGFTLVAWDLAAAGGTGLGEVGGFGPFEPLPTFAPDDRSFVYSTVHGDNLLWNGRQHEVVPLDAGITQLIYGPEGNQLLYVSEGALVHRDLRTGSRFEIATSVHLPTFSPDGAGIAYFRAVPDSFVEFELVTWDRESRASTVRATIGQPVALSFDPSGSHLFVLDAIGGLHHWSSAGLRTLSEVAQELPLFAPDGGSFLYHDGMELLWIELGSDQSVSLGTNVASYPAAWDPSGRQLFYVTDGGFSRSEAFGDAWLFHPETRRIEQVGSDAWFSTGRFVADGTLLLLRRYDRTGLRGELARGEEVVGDGITHGYRTTPNADRVLFRTDALPVRRERVVALWDRPGAVRLGAPQEEEPAYQGGMTPVDAGVTDQIVDDGWIAWVSQPAVEQDRSGIYVSHYPRDLPPPPPPPAPPEEEEVDEDTNLPAPQPIENGNEE